MDYFYVLPIQVQGSTAILKGDEFKHLVKVVRKKVGDRVILLDGEDNAYEGVLRRIGKESAEFEILEKKTRLNEPDLDVTVAVSILRNPARFDVLVEKVTELGVREIVPMVSERTIPKREKHARLENIAISAMKQCGRSYLPRIRPLSTLEDVLSSSDRYAVRLMPHEQAASSQSINALMGTMPAGTSILFLVGPEGGFTDEEVERARAKGFEVVTLGRRRLRTETAAIAAVSVLLTKS